MGVDKQRYPGFFIFLVRGVRGECDRILGAGREQDV